MPEPRVLFAASEVYPFAKTGGLADVAYSLPRAMADYCSAEVIMPLYAAIDRRRFGIGPVGKPFALTMGGRSYTMQFYECEYEGMTYRFVYEPTLCDREYLYGPAEHGYEDNAERFGLFCHGVVAALRLGNFDLVHLNDWQSALVALLLEEESAPDVGSVYTIHNLAYQGIFGAEVLPRIGIASSSFTMEGIEFYGKMNFMKAGIAYSDRITTVSPTYAKEIMTPEFGCGLEGFLQRHRAKLEGILNGIDTDYFNPGNDSALAVPYTSPAGKRSNKKAYLEKAGLKGVRKPLFVFIGRFTWQKGLDLLIEALPKMAALPCNIAILGEGEAVYHVQLETIAKRYGNVSLVFGYDESLSHRMYAAADFLLMPSRFEPCGLNQMIAMHYGALPVVRRVGGLADTVTDVRDLDAAGPCGYGFDFEAPTAAALYGAFERAIAFYGDKKAYATTASHDMHCDFSWKMSARKYALLYTEILTGEKQ